MGTLVLAIKFNEDDYFSNEFYSKVCGVSNQEFNKLESEAYDLLDHTLWIDLILYEKYEVYLKHYKMTHKEEADLND